MKIIRLMTLLALMASIYSCSDNNTVVTEETDIIVFDPNEDPSSSVLKEYPEGLISFNYNGQEETIERASALVSSQETLIITEFVDAATGDPTKLIIGVKGFATGDFQGNVIGYNLIPPESDLADITITEYGAVGEAISGSFSVEYGGAGSEVSVSGDFTGLRVN